MCDVCKSCSFETLEEAEAHEEQCVDYPPPQGSPRKESSISIDLAAHRKSEAWSSVADAADTVLLVYGHLLPQEESSESNDQPIQFNATLLSRHDVRHISFHLPYLTL